jgi:hypothetical protein
MLLSKSPEGPGEPPTGISLLFTGRRLSVALGTMFPAGNLLRSSEFPESHRCIEESSLESRQQSLRYGQDRDALVLLVCI